MPQTHHSLITLVLPYPRFHDISTILVTRGQSWSKNVTWKIPEITLSFKLPVVLRNSVKFQKDMLSPAPE